MATTAWQAPHLVAGQHARAVGRAAQDGGDHQQAAVARANEQAHALHFPVAAHAEVRVLPARRSSSVHVMVSFPSLLGAVRDCTAPRH